MFPYKGNGKVIRNINKEMNISLNKPLSLLDKKSVFKTLVSTAKFGAATPLSNAHSQL